MLFREFKIKLCIKVLRHELAFQCFMLIVDSEINELISKLCITGTVDRVLHNRGDLKEETKAKIQECYKNQDISPIG